MTDAEKMDERIRENAAKATVTIYSRQQGMKPCPFCGGYGTVVRFSHPSGDSYQARCAGSVEDVLGGCGATIRERIAFFDAVAAWNARLS